jgi:hypothetical protein
LFAAVKKLTVFQKDPTKQQVDLVSTEKAREKGADAAVNVNCSEGIGFTTWGISGPRGLRIRQKTRPRWSIRIGKVSLALH